MKIIALNEASNTHTTHNQNFSSLKILPHECPLNIVQMDEGFCMTVKDLLMNLRSTFELIL